MPVPEEQDQNLRLAKDKRLTLADKTYPFKSLVPCDLRNFTRR